MDEEKILDHAWKYFEIHSNQRITLFNYFLFIVAAFGTALGALIQTSEKLSFFGCLLSFFLSVVSIFFLKLDQRTAFLIKQSEDVLIKLETKMGNDLSIFSQENQQLADLNKQKNFLTEVLTYRVIFRGVFLITGLVGFVLFIYFFNALKVS